MLRGLDFAGLALAAAMVLGPLSLAPKNGSSYVESRAPQRVTEATAPAGAGAAQAQPDTALRQERNNTPGTQPEEMAPQ